MRPSRPLLRSGILVGGLLVGGTLILTSVLSTAGQETPSRFQPEIDTLNAAIASAPPGTGRTILEEKLKNAEDDKAAEEAGRKAVAANPGLLATVAALQATIDANDHGPTYPTGTPAGAGQIFDFGGPSNDFGRAFYPGNSWATEIEPGRFLGVYAGASTTDHSKGMLWVEETDRGGAPVAARGSFPAPARKGELRITGADGFVLTVRAADGTVLHFDAKALAWVP